jgi:putative photosynthetic complex assembly protein
MRPATLLHPPRRTVPRAPEVIPPWAPRAAGVLLLAVVLIVATWRFLGLGPDQQAADALAVRELRFDDGPAGSVQVRDANTGALLETVHGEAGFLRGTLRALVRERQRRGIGAGPAFLLVARADGGLTLRDPATGERIDLDAFGPAQVAVYSRWLPAPPARTPAPAGVNPR